MIQIATNFPVSRKILNATAFTVLLGMQVLSPLARSLADERPKQVAVDLEDSAKVSEKAILEFRVEAASSGNDVKPLVDEATYAEWSQELKASGPSSLDDVRFGWFPTVKTGDKIEHSVRFEGRDYVLLSLQPNHAMRWDGSWRIQSFQFGSTATPNNASPTFSVTMDESGGRQLKLLTERHLHRKLAVVVGGEVLVAPQIRSVIGSKFQLTGNFDRATIEQLNQEFQRAISQSKL